MHVKLLSDTDFDFLENFSNLLIDKLKIDHDRLSLVYILFIFPEEFSILSKEHLNKVSTDTITINFDQENNKYSSFIYVNVCYIYKCFESKIFFENSSKASENSFCLFLLEKILHAFMHSLGYIHDDDMSRKTMFLEEKKIKKMFFLIIK